MMSIENIVNEHSKKIAILETKQNDYERIATGLHELSKSMAAMTIEIKLSSENHSKTLEAAIDSTSKSIERLISGQKGLGERVGDVEKSLLRISRNEEDIKDISDKLDTIRIEPGNNWKQLVGLIVGGLVAGGLGVLLGGGLPF